VPCGDEILQQLDKIAFGNENAGKKKRKTGAASSDDVVWKKKKYFFQIAVLERQFASAKS